MTVSIIGYPTYIPFVGVKSNYGGPIGTATFDIHGYGDTSGGDVILRLHIANATNFGFRALFVPTAISTEHYGVAQNITVKWSTENQRWNGSGAYAYGIETIQKGTGFYGFTPGGLLPLGLQSNADAEVLQGNWGTNTNAASYHIHGYGVVYNMEELAKGTTGQIRGPLIGQMG